MANGEGMLIFTPVFISLTFVFAVIQGEKEVTANPLGVYVGLLLVSFIITVFLVRIFIDERDRRLR